MEESLEFSQKLCGQHHRWTQVPLEHILYEVPDLHMRTLTANYICIQIRRHHGKTCILKIQEAKVRVGIDK